MKYVTEKEVLILHARILDKTGGSHGVRDTGLVISACARPKTALGGKEMYKDVFAKCAVFFESMVFNHAFVDGNKRTSIVACALFLFKNGFELSASNTEVVEFVLKVVTKKTSIRFTAKWFKKNSKPAKLK